ncbi:hypothetical protein ACNFCI_23050 [Pseudomonas sp. NY15356]|uniref:hypothetical protein n=1 Tax=unclassified Pseudomonas TaxID=196821 RepID=UPI003A8B0F2C
MSTWDKMQQLIDELRTGLTSIQNTVAKLDAALAERAEKARKNTDVSGAAEMDLERFATKAQIAEEASARECADAALASRIGTLEARLSRVEAVGSPPRDAMADYRPGTALLAGRYPTAIDRYAVTVARSPNGQCVCTGVGAGIDPTQGETKDGQTDLELAIEKGDVSQALLKLASSIAESNLGLELRSKIDAADPVREVIRKELRPGGLLYRR